MEKLTLTLIRDVGAVVALQVSAKDNQFIVT